MYKTAIVECRVCGDQSVLGVDLVVKAKEIADFAESHAGHERFDIHLVLGLDNQAREDRTPLFTARQPA